MPTTYNKVVAGNQTLIDLSQDTVTDASHIMAGYIGHLADGTQVTGTGSGGGGGLEYETGTYTPASNISRPTINFAKTHSTTPLCCAVVDVSSNTTITDNSIALTSFFDSYRLNGIGYPYSTSQIRSALAAWAYAPATQSVTSIRYNATESSSASSSYVRYWADESSFRPYANSTSRYFRSGRSYKWIAIWAPTT